MNIKELKIKGKSYKLPIFLPDATLGIVRGLDREILEKTGTRGVVVNTYHLNDTPGIDVLKKYSVAKVQPSQNLRRLDLCKSGENNSGIKNFMNFDGLVVSDSGGWQVFSLIKRHGEGGEITDEGVKFNIGGEVNKKMGVFTPEDSIQIQFKIGADILICLDDFTGANDNEEEIKESVERTILWARRTRVEFDKIVKKKKLTDETRPLLFAVIQGGWNKELRKYCAEELFKIGFDGYGYGGYMVNDKGELDEEMSKYIAELIPDKYPKFALGVGKPWDIARCYEFGWDIFDCVLPTRDGRHKRLYNFKSETKVSKAGLIERNDSGVISPAFSERTKIKKLKSTETNENQIIGIEQVNLDLKSPDSYEFTYISRGKFSGDIQPIGLDCDCFTCQNYSKGYLHHLFKIKDTLAYRLAVIHNLRIYNRLIEMLSKSKI
jgi:queuine tRNA-ribosyltransferase